MNHTSCKDTEIQFGRDDQDTTNLEVWTRPDGTVGFLTGHPEGDERYIATLGQAIQLRDFLNRHIDGLALAATGSLAVRSSDDPAQLASEEFIASVQEGIADAEAGNLVSLDDVKAKWTGTGLVGCGKDLPPHNRVCGGAVRGRGTLYCSRCGTGRPPEL